jgi:excinuclease ABC subunit A
VPVHFESLSGSGVYNIVYEGIIPSTMRRYRETTSENAKAMYEEYMREEPCSACHGMRLRPEALAVTVNDVNIAELSDMNLKKAIHFLGNLSLSNTEH